MTGTLSFLSKFAGKFFQDGLPLALAGAVCTLVVNHYTRSPEPPPAVVHQAPALPAGQTVTQLVHEEHDAIAGYLKHDADKKRTAEAAADNAAKARQPAPAADERAPRPRVAAADAKASPLPPAKPVAERRIAAVEPLPLTPAPISPAAAPAPVAAAPAPAPTPIAAGKAENESRVGRVRDWVANVTQLPSRLLGAAEDFMDSVPTPPLPVPVAQFQARM